MPQWRQWLTGWVIFGFFFSFLILLVFVLFAFGVLNKAYTLILTIFTSISGVVLFIFSIIQWLFKPQVKLPTSDEWKKILAVS